MNNRLPLYVRSIAVIFWLGFFMAISFMEAPLKFTAPGLSMAEGLQVGKIIFNALNICEWAFLAIIYSTCIFKKPSRRGTALLVIITIIMLLETFWLLPVLDRAATRIISGHDVADHTRHWFYVILEVVKVPVLLLLGIDSLKMLCRETN